MLKASGYFDEVREIDEQLMNRMLYGIWAKEEINNVGRHQADSDNNTDNFVIF
jgi:hypothetical protein